MLATRVMAALVFAPALLALVWMGGLAVGLACLAVALLMSWEYQRLVFGPGQRFLKAVGMLLTAAVAAGVTGWLSQPMAAIVFPAGAMVAWSAVLAQPSPIQSAAGRVAALAFGAIYCGGLLPYLARIRHLGAEEGQPLLGLSVALLALFCTWGADTGAYFAGKLLGRHKLYPKISPGKTMEGCVGGLIAALGVALIVFHLFAPPFAAVHAVAMGALAVAIGTLGDLCESLLKRSVGAKDSSHLIPGHGGVLDRFDGVMFAAPALFAYAAIVLS